MKINWNSDTKEDARYVIHDVCTTSYVSEDQISIANGKIRGMRSVAEAYAESYEHSGTEDIYAVCEIEDVEDGEQHRFAFDGHGNFEWDTTQKN